jgi:hypothetical protein
MILRTGVALVVLTFQYLMPAYILMVAYFLISFACVHLSGCLHFNILCLHTPSRLLTFQYLMPAYTFVDAYIPISHACTHT